MIDATPSDPLYLKDINVDGGSIIEVCLNSNNIVHKKYYSLPTVGSLNITEKEALQNLDSLIYNAVKLRLRSDVPLEANLSGGLDSSAIVAYASKILGAKNLTTHTFDYIKLIIYLKVMLLRKLLNIAKQIIM